VNPNAVDTTTTTPKTVPEVEMAVEAVDADDGFQEVTSKKSEKVKDKDKPKKTEEQKKK